MPVPVGIWKARATPNSVMTANTGATSVSPRSTIASSSSAQMHSSASRP